MIPSKIKVGPHTYSVVWSTKSEMDNKLGWCNSIDQTITLAEDQHKDSLRDTLLHEVMHAILWISHNHTNMEEERLVSSVTPWMILVFRDNPKLTEYLFSK